MLTDMDFVVTTLRSCQFSEVHAHTYVRMIVSGELILISRIYPLCRKVSQLIMSKPKAYNKYTFMYF